LVIIFHRKAIPEALVIIAICKPKGTLSGRDARVLDACEYKRFDLNCRVQESLWILLKRTQRYMLGACPQTAAHKEDGQ